MISQVTRGVQLIGYLILMAPYLMARTILRQVYGAASRRLLAGLFGWQTLLDYLHWLKARIGIQHVYLARLTVGQPYFHERTVSRLVKASKGKLFVDLGAHLGHFTILAASNFNRVIAVEPHPDYARTLRGLLHVQRLSDKVEVVESAIGDADGRTPLYIHDPSGSVSIRDRIVTYTPTFEERRHRKIGETKVQRFSSLLNGKDADLVKVDIEGAEWSLLKPETLTRSKSWIIECHDRRRLGEMQESFRISGFQTRMLDDDHVFAWRVK